MTGDRYSNRADLLTQTLGLSHSLYATFGKINLLSAALARVFSIKFIREYLNLFSTIGAFALERFKTFQLLIAGTVLRCRHDKPPL